MLSINDKSHYETIWDTPLRTFHWLFAIAIVASYITGQISGEWLYWHIHVGNMIVSLLLFRIIWGFTGTPSARFVTFMPTPRRIKEYYLSKRLQKGHSPLGALSVFAMLLVTLSQSLLGLFSLNDEIDIQGPFYYLVSTSISERFTSLHVSLHNVLVILVGLHVFAIAYYAVVKKRNLVSAMLYGQTNQQCLLKTNINFDASRYYLFLVILVCTALYWAIESGALLELLS